MGTRFCTSLRAELLSDASPPFSYPLFPSPPFHLESIPPALRQGAVHAHGIMLRWRLGEEHGYGTIKGRSG